MARNQDLKKVMIIGSGPIVIGQAAEFDYSGTQACKAIKEEGIETILVNSNPATIMTDENIADKVYMEPLKVEALEYIIKREKPDGILAGFGGQTALNLAMKLKEEGILDKYNVKLLGTGSETIKKAEDREEFKRLMIEIGEPVPASIIATSLKECYEFVKKNGYPVIIRPAYTLGGTGGGIATNEDELTEICQRGLINSPIGQILLEQSVAGWKEIEYEVIRDKKDNCIVICNMENIDPVGIHTGDSIVVAPSQTLRDSEYQMLRKAAIKIIRSLGVEGGCNVQFALDPCSNNYVVIEVNPRVSRSSALASKAAGYPIAKIAAKLAIGYSLDELKNYVTQNSSACFEPTLDYVVVKIPKWPFDKFNRADRTLGTQMKATGEVMAIDRSFESALLKAVTSLEVKATGLWLDSIMEMSDKELEDKIKSSDDERIFSVAEGLRRGVTVDKIHEITKIDKWFLNKIKNIVDLENKLKNEKLTVDLLRKAESMGFIDKDICELSQTSYEKLNKMRGENKIFPVYKMVDTCSGEFEAKTPYYYSCYEDENENIISDDKKILVIGSGPIRIGQGIEFDYCTVHGVWSIKEAGYQSIIINNNPETVSTDFDTADKLYFESLYIDNVMNVIREEKPEGVIVQFGGQTAVNLAQKLHHMGVKILGTQFDSIDIAEDREKFLKMLKEIGIAAPKGETITNLQEAITAAEKLGYPVLVRPSYVIGGRAMEVVYDVETLIKYINEAVNVSEERPILVDKYIKGIEIEIDAVSDGEDILIPGIMEHIEKTGVHSGDSITVYPPITLSNEVVEKLIKYTKDIAIKLKTVGLINIQYVYDGTEIYVIEVNPRASRTVPILSKVTGIPMVKLAVNAMIGKKLKDSSYGTGLMKNKNLYAVKVPVFSGEKLTDVDIYLGPEMKSTGEVLGLDSDFDSAVYKGFAAAGFKIPVKGNVYVALKETDYEEGLNLIKDYVEAGFKIYASCGTADYLIKNNIDCEKVVINDATCNISNGSIDLIINIPTRSKGIETSGFRLRKKALEYKIPIFTSLDTAKIFLNAIKVERDKKDLKFKTLKEYLSRK